MAVPRRSLTYQGVMRALYGPRVEGIRVADADRMDAALPVGIALKGVTSSGAFVDQKRLAEVDAQDEVRYDNVVRKPLWTPLVLPLDVAVTTRRIFVNPFPWTIRVRAIYENHTTAESTASTLTAYIEKTPDGIAAGSGTSVMSGTFNLKATADTPQKATLSTVINPGNSRPYIELAQGEGLSWVISAAATELADVTLTIYVDPGGKAGICCVLAQDNTRCVDRWAHVANVPKTITYTACVFGTKAAAAANALVTRGQSTETPTQGDALLTNDTSAGFELDGAANTVQYGTLTSTAAHLRLETDDRLGIDFSGTVTAVRNLVIVIGYTPARDCIEIDMQLLLDADVDNKSRSIFIANRPMRVIDIRFIHGVADAGEDMDLEKNASGTAAGGGTGLLTDDSGNGFDAGATANTVQVGTLVGRGYATLLEYDRLDAQGSDTDDTLANVCMTVLLEAA